VSIKFLKLAVSEVDGFTQAKGVDEHFPSKYGLN